MPQLLSFDDAGLQFAWDSTSIKIAQECLYKYKLKMLDGWTPHRRSVHLDFGGWYAAALESFHKYRADGLSVDDALAEVIAEALTESWMFPDCEACEGKGDTDTGTCEECGGNGKATDGGEPWASDHNAKTRENLIRTIIWYVDHFEDDPCQTVILSDGRAAVEHSFRLEADNGLMLSGHLDRLVEYGGKPYIQDQKTTATTITPRYFEQWNTDTQMSLYTFAGKSIFGIPVKGVVIDAAQIAVGFSRFERGFTFRDDPQLNEWYDNAMFHVEAARNATREQVFPMNTSSCNNYGGCQFRHVCGRSPAVRKQFLEADFYKGERWDPLKVR
jgi:hypothetical protein